MTRTTNPKVDAFLRNATTWQAEMSALRTIALDSPMTEELKWGVPCYTHEDRNVVIIHGFKNYCALLFVKGALLKDPKGILVRQTTNVQAGRQIRFTGLQEITAQKRVLKSYIQEAINVEKAGLKVAFKDVAEYSVPEEFQSALKKSAALKKAFHALTPGRQRAYLLYFSGAKQSATRASRVAKFAPHILAGKGMDDR